MVKKRNSQKIKLSFIKENYIVSKDGTTVVCLLTCKPQVPQSQKYYFILENFLEKFVKKNYPKFFLNFTTRGIASLKSNDSSNVELGKRIALNKAKRLAYAHEHRLMREFLKEWNNIGSLIENSRDVFADMAETTTGYIKFIAKEGLKK